MNCLGKTLTKRIYYLQSHDHREKLVFRGVGQEDLELRRAKQAIPVDVFHPATRGLCARQALREK